MRTLFHRRSKGMLVAAATAIACASVLAACSRPSGVPTMLAAGDAGETRGFVLTTFVMASRESGDDVCPKGYAWSEREFYLASLPPAQRAREERANTDWIRRVSVDRKGPNQCRNPRDYPDPGHITLAGPATAYGFDLDNAASGAKGFATCPHTEFSGSGGEKGIDNQLWRVLGCVGGYQPGRTIDEYAVANIKSGSRTILIELSQLDDPRNDPDVTVGIYSSDDPVMLDSAGNIMRQASFHVADNRRYHARLEGRLVDGVLTAGPIEELRLEYNGQYLESEYQFRQAQVRIEMKEDGTIEGLIGGYWDVEGFYDAHARQATRAGAFTVGYTCPGIYGALYAAADAYPDPETGQCTAISGAFRLQGTPAFVIHGDQAAVTVAANAEPVR